jgi:RimJ/RimL family protein N-acetyltransferase
MLTRAGTLAREQGVLEKCGFVREGHFKQNVFWNDAFRDSLVYSKLAPSNDRAGA